MNKSFSERMGIEQPKGVLPFNSMTQTLINCLWNVILDLFEHHYWNWAAKVTARDFVKVPTDEIPSSSFDQREWIKMIFFSLEWNRVYDFVEFITMQYALLYASNHSRDEGKRVFLGVQKKFNAVFERERSVYRFHNGVLEPIPDTLESDVIDEAMKSSEQSGLEGSQKHLKSALDMLAKRPDPDWRNAIREAISAVESASKVISGKEKASLPNALGALKDKGIYIHQAMELAFIKLYGYTSDEPGLRHAMIDEPSVGLDEARFMVFACSAFVTFLISKAQDVDVL